MNIVAGRGLEAAVVPLPRLRRLACSIVHVPTSEEEDDKRPSRERERLLKERTAHTNRIKALLHAQGIRDVKPLARDFLARLKDARTGDGRALPPRLAAEIARERERLVVVDRQIAAIEAESRAECRKAAPGSSTAKIVQLAKLKGLGITDGRVLVKEVFYRRFANRRQVGACVGLAGTPYSSGEEERDQGISKAGDRRARTAAIELAWRWTRWQPDSALTRWFKARVGDAKGRVRRIAIVALARKLMVALWRYLETGLVPDGAVLSPSF
jgi:transposase